MLSQSFVDMHRGTDIRSHPMYTFPAEVEQGNALLSCFNSHTVNKCLFFVVLCFSRFGDFTGPPSVALKCYVVFLSARKL